MAQGKEKVSVQILDKKARVNLEQETMHTNFLRYNGDHITQLLKILCAQNSLMPTWFTLVSSASRAPRNLTAH